MPRVFAVLILIAVSAAAPGGASSAQFKGLSALSKELSARIATEESPIELDTYMPADGLDDLVGTWSAFGSEHVFQNGQPNAVSVVLLRLTFSGFATALADNCLSSRLTLNDPFHDVLEALCTWPSDEARSDEVMMAFWLGLMGYNAPEKEYAVWRDFVRRTYGGKSAKEAITAMSLAIFLNPYFLLSQ